MVVVGVGLHGFSFWAATPAPRVWVGVIVMGGGREKVCHVLGGGTDVVGYGEGRRHIGGDKKNTYGVTEEGGGEVAIY
jgi:hypothetical protein